MGFATARATSVFELLNGDQYTFLGRTMTMFPACMKLTGVDRFQQQLIPISASQSALSLMLNPLGNSAPVGMLFFLADQPVDIRVGSADASYFLSAVYMALFGGNVSNVFVSTSNATQVLICAAGGSNTTLTATTPLP